MPLYRKASGLPEGGAPGQVVGKAADGTPTWVVPPSTFRWRGPWAASTAYAVDDAFTHNGTTYRVTTAHTSPTVFDSLGTEFQVLAAKGSDGAPGAKGDPGAAGAKGDPGPPGASPLLTGAGSKAVRQDSAGTANAAGGQGSFAIGEGTTANGFASFAGGVNTQATGGTVIGEGGAVALGQGAIANGRYAPIALGYNAKASGNAAGSLGHNNNAVGHQSVALGNTSVTYGEGSVAAGRQARTGASTDATGVGAFAAGQGTVATGGTTAADGGATALGNSTQATGTHGALAAGYQSVASGSHGATAVGGNGVASGPASFVANFSNTASAESSACFGSSNQATSFVSLATGTASKTTYRAQHAQSSGTFQHPGDAQRSTVVARRVTTDATVSTLTLDGTAPAAANVLAVPVSRVLGFEATITATEPATGDTVVWTVVGACVRLATGSVRMVGAPAITKVAADTGAGTWALAVDAGLLDTFEQLRFNVTGEAAHTIRWLANITLTETGTA